MKKHLKLKKTCIVKHRRISHEAKKVLEWPASCSRRSGQTNTFRHPERQESVLRNDPSTPCRKLHPKTAKKAPKRDVVVSIWIDFGQNPGPATHRDWLKKQIFAQILRRVPPPSPEANLDVLVAGRGEPKVKELRFGAILAKILGQQHTESCSKSLFLNKF